MSATPARTQFWQLPPHAAVTGSERLVAVKNAATDPEDITITAAILQEWLESFFYRIGAGGQIPSSALDTSSDARKIQLANLSSAITALIQAQGPGVVGFFDPASGAPVDTTGDMSAYAADVSNWIASGDGNGYTEWQRAVWNGGTTGTFATDFDLVDAPPVVIAHGSLTREMLSQSLQRIIDAYGDPYSVGAASPADGTILGTSASTRLIPTSLISSGTVTEISYYGKAAGAGNIRIYSRNGDGSFNYEKTISLTIALGAQTAVAGVDFNAVEVEAGWYIGIATSSTTGRISYDAGDGEYLARSGLNEFDDNLEFTLSSVGALQLFVQVTPTTGSVKEDMNALNVRMTNAEETLAPLPGLVAASTSAVTGYGPPFTSGAAAPSTGSSLGTGQATRIHEDPLVNGGQLTELRYFGTFTGAASIRFYSRNGDDTFKFETAFSLTIALGAQVATAGDDFTAIEVEAGWYWGISTSSATGRISFLPGGGWFSESTLNAPGDSIAFATSSANTLQLGVVITPVATLAEDIERIDASLAALDDSTTLSAVADQLRGSSTIFSSRFFGTSTPANWTLGAWSVDDGLQSPAVGGWDAVSLTTARTNMQRKTARARIRFVDATSAAGIIFLTDQSSRSDGTIIIYDGDAAELRIYPDNGTGGTPTPAITEAVPWAAVAGREYLITCRKVGCDTIISLTDTVTRAAVEVEVGAEDEDIGRQWGYAGVILLSGEVVVTRFDFVANVGVNPHAVIIGDSNTEANVLGGDWERGYAHQIEALRGKGDTLVVGRSSATSVTWAGTASRTTQERGLAPDYVVINLGTNDSNHATWRTNMATLIGLFEAVGSVPVLCTVIPETGAETKLAAMNNDIRSYYFGDYAYIDFARAVSDGNDGVTVDAALMLDAVHPTAAGHDLMVAQSQIDAPFLFE